jgi:hypothetical protein
MKKALVIAASILFLASLVQASGDKASTQNTAAKNPSSTSRPSPKLSRGGSKNPVSVNNRAPKTDAPKPLPLQMVNDCPRGDPKCWCWPNCP